MRTAVLLFALTLGLASLPVTAIDVVAAPQTASPQAAAQPPVQADVDVDVHRGGGVWYTSPMWIAIGVIAVVLLVVIIAMAARGGGTTIVRD